MAEFDEVTQILSCNTYYQVLKLQQPNKPPVFVDTQQVRKRYKELAIRVHPDKNRSSDAEAAFKRLSEAYECLVDETSQRNYLHQLQARQPNVRGKATPQKYKYKRKRKTQSETQTDGGGEQLPKRRRTPEEIWKEFQREEEELARQHFHIKGFDRVYDATSKRGTAGEKPSSPPAVSLEKQQEILDSNLDVKAKNWASWRTPTSTPKKKEDEAPDPTPTDTVAPAASANDVSPTLICCLLCRRKFHTTEALKRHETLSKLHAANLQSL